MANWINTVLGGLFPNKVSAVSGQMSKANKRFAGLSGRSVKLNTKLNSVGQNVSELSGMTAALNQDGVYVITLPPGNGGFVNRLNTASGSPPAAGPFSAGIAITIVAPSEAEAASKFTNIMKVLNFSGL